jgi:hypothetical protein
MIGEPLDDGTIQEITMLDPEILVTGGWIWFGAVVTTTVIVLEYELKLYEFRDLILNTYVAPVVAPLNR